MSDRIDPRLRLAAGLAVLLSLPIAATPNLSASQEPHQHDPGRHSPYADQGDTGIAALSPAELQGLEEGEGMGLARAAELNGYPGPKHVLELADELELEAETRAAVEAVRRAMRARAQELGARIIEAERILDRRFGHRHVDADTVRQMTVDVGRLRGELRAVHLVAHLETTALLSAEQIEAYARLRGYAESP